jgi:Tfp pilus assembly protein PilO
MALLRKLAEWRLLALLICLGIIGYVFYSIVIVPISIELDSIRAETVAVNQKITSLPKKIQDLGRLRDDYDKAVSSLDIINSRVTHETALPYFTTELERTSKEAGTKLSSVSIGTLIPGSSYSRVPMTITCRGFYGQIRRFVQGLSKLERAFNISDFHLRTTGFLDSVGINEEQILDVTLSLIVYVVPKGGEN